MIVCGCKKICSDGFTFARVTIDPNQSLELSHDTANVTPPMIVTRSDPIRVRVGGYSTHQISFKYLSNVQPSITRLTKERHEMQSNGNDNNFALK